MLGYTNFSLWNSHGGKSGDVKTTKKHNNNCLNWVVNFHCCCTYMYRELVFMYVVDGSFEHIIFPCQIEKLQLSRQMAAPDWIIKQSNHSPRFLLESNKQATLEWVISAIQRSERYFIHSYHPPHAFHKRDNQLTSLLIIIGHYSISAETSYRIIYVLHQR